MVNPAENEFIFGHEGQDDPIGIKDRLRHLLRDTLRDTDFNLTGGARSNPQYQEDGNHRCQRQWLLKGMCFYISCFVIV